MKFLFQSISKIMVGIFLAAATVVHAGDAFPKGPELTVTPGKLCDKPAKYRYAENVAYCERDVAYATKEYVINNYDQSFGYIIGKMKREDFKIDHLIPLCVGGSNDRANLWPQHKSVYAITDPLEPVVCAKMYQGKLKQSDAVLFVLEAKTHIDRVQSIIKHINSL